MHSNTYTLDTYVCYVCGVEIVDHVYSVQRRRIRSVPALGTVAYEKALKDAVNPWHGGIQLGPEYAPYCSTCYKEIDTIEELLATYKIGLKNENS